MNRATTDTMDTMDTTTQHTRPAAVEIPLVPVRGDRVAHGDIVYAAGRWTMCQGADAMWHSTPKLSLVALATHDTDPPEIKATPDNTVWVIPVTFRVGCIMAGLADPAVTLRNMLKQDDAQRHLEGVR